jgi:hypothetical protein
MSETNNKPSLSEAAGGASDGLNDFIREMDQSPVVEEASTTDEDAAGSEGGSEGGGESEGDGTGTGEEAGGEGGEGGESDEGGEGGEGKSEAEGDKPPELSLDANYLVNLLKWCADNGVKLPATFTAPEGDKAPETQVDSRNAVDEEPLEPFELTPDETDALCINEDAAKRLAPMFDRLQERMFNKFQKTVAKMVGRAQSELFGPLYVAQRYYDEHPEAESELGLVVNHAITLVKARHPEYTSRQIMADVKVMVDPIIAKVRKVSKQIDAADRGKSSGSRAPSMRPSAPSTPKPQTPTEAAVAAVFGGTKTDPALQKLGY